MITTERDGKIQLLLEALKEAKCWIVDDAEQAIDGHYATDVWRFNHKSLLNQIGNAMAKAEGLDK